MASNKSTSSRLVAKVVVSIIAAIIFFWFGYINNWFSITNPDFQATWVAVGSIGTIIALAYLNHKQYKKEEEREKKTDLNKYKDNISRFLDIVSPDGVSQNLFKQVVRDLESSTPVKDRYES